MGVLGRYFEVLAEESLGVLRRYWHARRVGTTKWRLLGTHPYHIKHLASSNTSTPPQHFTSTH